MSLFGRLLGQREGDPYADGVALYEAGRFADAIEALRRAAQRQGQAPAGSLAAFHLRQALVSEGKRLLEVGRAGEAVPLLAEAAGEWDSFPDLQFRLGVAQGLSGQWSAGLRSAQQALRLNPDYCEARLLEACALQKLGRPREAATSLDKLVEAGRRIHHPLVAVYSRPGEHDPANLPRDLEDRLREVVTAPLGRNEVAAAVALCRAGHWQEGIERFRDLVARHPRYPDYHVKLAGALFQVRQNDEAARAVEPALAIHPQYRTARLLKALIQADQGCLEKAWQVLATFKSEPEGDDPRRHEALFGAYLRGVLALLTGRWAEVEPPLARWSDLDRIFPRAELLRAATEDLQGRAVEAGGILANLSQVWPADPDYLYFHCCHLLQEGALDRLGRALGQWPGASDSGPDGRPLHLQACLALLQEKVPETPPAADDELASPAWRFLLASGLGVQGHWWECWQQAASLWEEGQRSEPLASLLVDAAKELPATGGPVADWPVPLLVPGALVPTVAAWLHRHGRGPEAKRLIDERRQLHPEGLPWSWLSTSFWLDPVRGWIG